MRLSIKLVITSILISFGMSGCVVIIPSTKIKKGNNHSLPVIKYIQVNDYYEGYPIYRYQKVRYIKREGRYYTITEYKRKHHRRKRIK